MALVPAPVLLAALQEPAASAAALDMDNEAAAAELLDGLSASAPDSWEEFLEDEEVAFRLFLQLLALCLFLQVLPQLPKEGDPK